MCGIVGYASTSGTGKSALDVVMEGLRRLEYRGYDSAGVALQTDGGLATAKRAGKLQRLTDALAESPLPGGHHRHRAHPLGHARRPDRRQRAPAPRRQGR
jgi:glucosamine--fructose-6-phosphate aminotransferase (isomerizing)